MTILYIIRVITGIAIVLVTTFNCCSGQSFNTQKLDSILTSIPLTGVKIENSEYELILLLLKVEDGTVSAYQGFYQRNSGYMLPVDTLLKNGITGLQIGNEGNFSILIPYTIGVVTKKNIEQSMNDALLIEGLKSEHGNSRLIIHPVAHIIGTISPPSKVRKLSE